MLIFRVIPSINGRNRICHIRYMLYSLVRLFDKKKMEYFDENYRQSHLYLSQRKFNKDCLDDGKQLELINKIIDTVSIDSE